MLIHKFMLKLLPPVFMLPPHSLTIKYSPTRHLLSHTFPLSPYILNPISQLDIIRLTPLSSPLTITASLVFRQPTRVVSYSPLVKLSLPSILSCFLIRKITETEFTHHNYSGTSPDPSFLLCFCS